MLRLLTAAVLLAACNGTPPPDDSGPVGVTDPTWHTDIQPFVARNCQACHVEGGAGGFALETHEQVSTLGTLMLDAIDGGRMPPWPADPECGEFANARLLEPSDVETFRNWLADGAPEGEPVGTPEPPPTVATIEPTHSAKVPGYVSTAFETDEYRCFVLDMDIPETMYLQATQVIAGSGQVHHVLVYALNEAQRDIVVQKDLEEEGAGYTCFGSPLDGQDFISLATVTEGFPNQIGAWVPGLDPAVQADDAAIRVDANSTVVLQVHYSPLGGEPEPDETEFQAVMTTDPPGTLVRTVPILIPELDIAPGDGDARFTREFRNYNDAPIAVTSMTSHMHLIGTTQTAEVLRADDSPAECALDIPDWDFDWQITYKRPVDNPIVLDPGDAIELTCGYDNSAANQPIIDGEQIEPRQVEWGDGTLDEMCILYLSVAEPYTPPADPTALPCAGTQACVDACGDTPDADCLMRCPEADADCSVCVLQNGIDCGMSLCGAGFLLNSDCITNCLITTLMFGGSTGECLAQQCADQYDPFVACANPKVESGGCDSALAGCGYPL